MVRVLVGDQYGIELRGVFADRVQAFRDLAKAETRVNEQTCPLASNERRVTATTASESANAQARGDFPWVLVPALEQYRQWCDGTLETLLCTRNI